MLRPVRGVLPVSQDGFRAAKLSHLPGVPIGEACARFGVTKTEVSRRARHSLTSNGTRTSGPISELDGVRLARPRQPRRLDRRRYRLVTFGETTWQFTGTWPQNATPPSARRLRAVPR